jgi:S1-C subfamily serine protease
MKRPVTTNNDNPASHGKAPRARRGSIAVAAVALAVVALAAIAWQAQRPSVPPHERAAQEKRLSELLQREAVLKGELDQLTAMRGPHCPPGYVAAPSGNAVDTADGVASGEKLAPLSAQALVDKLERATALVLLPSNKGLGIGTGFFVSPQDLVTNRHVVEASSDGSVLLVSRSLKQIQRGRVIAVTNNSDPGSPDFAIVRLEGGHAPGTLDMNTEPTKLSEVVAAGYPGLVMRGDASFKRLVRDGDLSAAPDLSLTRGTIQSIQDSFAGTPIIVHTASILQGNSGGPLVDACGRVVGVNTFIAVDQQQSGRVSYAIQARIMGAFSQRNGVAINRDPRPCG